MNYPRKPNGFAVSLAVALALLGLSPFPATAQNTTAGISLSQIPQTSQSSQQTQPLSPPRSGDNWYTCLDMHRFYTAEFLASDGFGISRVPNMHFMSVDQSKRLMFSKTLDGLTVYTPYKVDSFELIGVAKHNPPVAFDIEGQTHRTKPTETRPLTDFEAKALKSLLAGQDIVIGNDASEYLVVGAIRAQPSCLECHQDQKKDAVLGAFSYRLSPAVTNPAPLEKRGS
jgi:hypothetical protein